MKKFKGTPARNMSLSTPEARETVTTLRDRLKHGQNMTKILESQLDTAQQNISLLQGQVRLANETILNLKKYFQETENTINELLTPNHQPPPSRKFHFENVQHKESGEDMPSSKNSVASEARSRSPRTPESTSDSTKMHHQEDNKRDSHNKSPYAQQLRQVLDVLQDEEPRKSAALMHHHQSHHNDKDCNCNDCQPTPSRPSSSKSSYHEGEHYHHRRKVSNSDGGDYCKVKHKMMNGHANDCHEQVSPKSPYYRRGSESNSHHNSSYGSQHCMGPCCQSDSPSNGYKMIEKPSSSSTSTAHYIDSEHKPPTHYLEKSPSGAVHYIAVHSPPDARDVKHSPRHHGGGGIGGHHINYVPYAYHMQPENPHKQMHEVVPPMSPSGRRKRAYVPLLPNEEPPHLKYTKVKRIDGSKLTAQKVLQDFTKRRFIAYNPRYDLDLLIVPPPIPASDLMKAGSKGLRVSSSAPPRLPPIEHRETNQIGTNPLSVTKHNSLVEGARSQMYPDSDAISPRDSSNQDDVFTDPTYSHQSVDDESPDDCNNNNNNNNSILQEEENNNNNKNNKTTNAAPWVPKQSMFSTKCIDVLPSIKEEPRSKLEDHISKLRHEQSVKSHANYHQNSSSPPNSPYNDTNNNNDSSPPPATKNMLIHERESSSPVSLVNRRTEQYCN